MRSRPRGAYQTGEPVRQGDVGRALHRPGRETAVAPRGGKIRSRASTRPRPRSTPPTSGGEGGARDGRRLRRDVDGAPPARPSARTDERPPHLPGARRRARRPAAARLAVPRPAPPPRRRPGRPHAARAGPRAHRRAEHLALAVGDERGRDHRRDRRGQLRARRAVRASDPRIRGETRPPRVFSFDELQRFAATAARTSRCCACSPIAGYGSARCSGSHRSDFDGEVFQLRGSAHAGALHPGDQPTKRHVRTVPVPAVDGELIRAMPARIDTRCCSRPRAGRIWNESNFRRDVWTPRRPPLHRALEGETRSRFARAAGRRSRRRTSDRPHDCRHSWITHLRPPASTTPTWPRSPATRSRRWSAPTPTRSGGPTTRSEG